MQPPRIVGSEGNLDRRGLCRMPSTSSWWALETPLILARRGSGKRPSGGHGGGCNTIEDRTVAAAIGVIQHQPYTSR